MSEKNVELVRRAYDALNRRDLDTVLALTDPEVTVIPRILSVEGGTMSGHEGVRRWWEELSSAFPDVELEVIEVRGFGEGTVANIRVRGHGGGSRAPFLDDIWHVCRFRNGRVVWWKTFGSRAEALEAAGLAE